MDDNFQITESALRLDEEERTEARARLEAAFVAAMEKAIEDALFSAPPEPTSFTFGPPEEPSRFIFYRCKS